jgi:glutamate--cysteine ligase
LGVQVARTGLDTPFKGCKVQDLALEVLAIAKQGLEARGLDEEKFLDRLFQIAEANETGAAKLLKLYETKWNHSVDPIYSNRKIVF